MAGTPSTSLRFCGTPRAAFSTPVSDGVTIDTAVVLEEVQAQGYLSLLDHRYDDALDWTNQPDRHGHATVS